MITSFILAGVTVTLPMEAKVHGTEITLDEIATVTGEDAEAVARVASVELGYAPMPGYSRLFFAQRIEEIVERKTGVDVTLTGDRACRAWPTTEVVAGTAFDAAARTELERLTAELDVEFELVQPARDLTVPSGTAPAAIEAFFDGEEVRTGMVGIAVRVLVDGEIYRTVWTNWRVSVFEKRSVLRRDVIAGERIGLDHFTQKRVVVPRVGGANPLGRQMVVGAVATRDLTADQVVTNLDVHRPVLLHRGDSILLQVRKGGITARVPAIARENGAVGDRVLVTLTGSEREMGAVVLSRDLVEVVLDAKP